MINVFLRYLYDLATDRRKGVLASIIKVVLFGFSLIYGLIVRVLIFLSRRRLCRLGCKVISVGNITLGGTGKTPLVEFIARYLQKQGRKVAILSRGYKGADEPKMLAEKLKDIPIIVNMDRVKAAQEAIKDYGVDTVILDDGFQQWRIKKDLEIVALDAASPFGNGCLLPRGILREPLSSLARADVIVMTNVNKPKEDNISLRLPAYRQGRSLRRFAPRNDTFFNSTHKPIGFYEQANTDKILSIDTIKGKKVVLFSGIGNPDAFENSVCGLGAEITAHFKFPDHYNYSKRDLEKVFNFAKDYGADIVITTEKDAVRLRDVRCTMYDVRFLILRIEISIKDEERFYNRLYRVYND